MFPELGELEDLGRPVAKSSFWCHWIGRARAVSISQRVLSTSAMPGCGNQGNSDSTDEFHPCPIRTSLSLTLSTGVFILGDSEVSSLIVRSCSSRSLPCRICRLQCGAPCSWRKWPRSWEPNDLQFNKESLMSSPVLCHAVKASPSSWQLS